MKPENYRELSDRLEYTLAGEYFVEEFICVDCPLCGETTLRVVTSYQLTHYVHVRHGTNQEDYCTVERGEAIIPRALLYMPHEGVSVISLVEGLW
ncbi:hypothetical protein LCGC14_1590740 [marine sediment metagenome]|uniref:Uncharacterized protein n=1 Tax=marine sediment metagenome TaxID=412755 RepID=A0A0F9LEI9_9ZZZZ